MVRFSKGTGLVAGAGLIATVWALAVHPYQVDSLHSSVAFGVPIAGGLSTLQGRFNKFNAVINYDPNDATRSSVKATIDVSSLDTGVAARDKHTLGKDGFDVEKYPTITFLSKRIAKDGEGFDCVGELNFRGIRKEITIHFHPTGSRSMGENQKLLGFQGTFKIDRRDYGMNWQMSHDNDWIGNVAEVQLSVLARPK